MVWHRDRVIVLPAGSRMGEVPVAADDPGDRVVDKPVPLPLVDNQSVSAPLAQEGVRLP